MHFQTNLNVFVFYHVQVSSLHPYPMILAKYKETRGGLIIYTWTLALLSAQYCMCTTATKCCRESLDILLPQTLISFTPDALLQAENRRTGVHATSSMFMFRFFLLFASLPYILTPLPLPRGGCRTRKMFIWAGSSMLANCCNAAVLKIYKYVLQYSNSGLTAVDFCLLAVLQQGRLLCMW